MDIYKNKSRIHVRPVPFDNVGELKRYLQPFMDECSIISGDVWGCGLEIQYGIDAEGEGFLMISRTPKVPIKRIDLLEDGGDMP